MKALVLQQIGKLEYTDVPLPEVASDEVLLKIAASGICGSDISRIFTKGTYTMPLIPGHEFAGEVVEVGKNVSKELLNRKAAVFPLIPCGVCAYCRAQEYAVCTDYNYYGSRRNGGFAEYCAIKAWNLVLMEDNVSYQESAMLEPSAVALHALRQGKITVGDNVGIAGAGPIGLMLACWADICGAKSITLWDIDQTKVDFAKKMGFNAVNSSIEDILEYSFDLCIEGAGVGATVAQVLKTAKPLGRVVLMGNPAGDMNLSQKVYWEILRKQLIVTGTWNSSYSDVNKNEWKLSADAFATEKLKVERFITHKLPLNSAMVPFEMMRERKEFFNKVMYVL